MKLIYDTKELKIDQLVNLDTLYSGYEGQISATRESFTNDNDENQKQAILNNIYNGNKCLIRDIFIVQVKSTGGTILLDGDIIIKTLQSFLRDGISIKSLIGNNDVVSPKFSQLMSSQKRKFSDFSFRTIVIKVSGEMELEEVIEEMELVF